MVSEQRNWKNTKRSFEKTGLQFIDIFHLSSPPLSCKAPFCALISWHSREFWSEVVKFPGSCGNNEERKDKNDFHFCFSNI